MLASAVISGDWRRQVNIQRDGALHASSPFLRTRRDGRSDRESDA